MTLLVMGSMQQRDSDGFPTNLWELLRGNTSDYTMIDFFSIVSAGAPVVLAKSTRPVMSTSKSLLKEIWHRLPPRDSEMRSHFGYVNVNKQIAYIDTENVFAQKQSRPIRLITEAEKKLAFEWSTPVGPRIAQDDFHALVRNFSFQPPTPTYAYA